METTSSPSAERFIYSVLFYGAPNAAQPRQKFFLFSSLAAIYTLFTPEQIGCRLGHLYNLKVPDGTAYTGKRCIIKRERLYSKPHPPATPKTLGVLNVCYRILG